MSDFIPKNNLKDPITIRIENAKLEMIDQLAAGYNISRSAFINQCIDYALKNMPQETKKQQ